MKLFGLVPSLRAIHIHPRSVLFEISFPFKAKKKLTTFIYI
jgi:hypothetical protein